MEEVCFSQGMKILNVYNKKDGHGRWRAIAECECSYCGNIFSTRHDNVKSRRVKSCGCQIGNRKHGHRTKKITSPTYNSWKAMKKRTLNSNHHAYERYRKLGMCERWMKFENFLEDMGERPDGFELHRVDNDKGYYPNNCEWKNKSKHTRDHMRQRVS